MPKIEEVRDLLLRIEVPPSNTSLLKSGWVRDLAVEEDRISFALAIPPELASLKEEIRTQVEAIVRENFPDTQVAVKAVTAPPPPKLQRPGATPGRPRRVEGVKHVVAVASGKGGVGKSTVAVNLTLALKELGLSVGIFDGDIWGPSVGRMLGLESAELRPDPDTGKVRPPVVHGIRMVTMAFFLDEQTPVIWRGAMIHKAYEQLFFDLDWRGLDVLVVDLPPGTGDPQLSLVQLVEVSGGLVVTTPQDVALLDVRRAIQMFEKVQVPVLGIVENMSVFRCPHCGQETRIFGEDGARRLSEEFGIPVLASLPLDPAVVRLSDEGRPVLLTDHPAREPFLELGRRILDVLQVRA